MVREKARPNPYRDVWLVFPSHLEHPHEMLTGGGELVVPADGEVYALSSLPPRLIGIVGMIATPDDEWD